MPHFSSLLCPYIITYQEKLGNYNACCAVPVVQLIITYQEKLGNYNREVLDRSAAEIITYQEKLGNYNFFRLVYIVREL